MPSNYVLYCSIWCPLEEIRDCIKKSQRTFKQMIDFIKNYGDDEGITFLELTEDALKNMPVLMVDNMECFTQENIDTMVFNIKEIKCREEYINSLNKYFTEFLPKIFAMGFRSEMIVLKEIKITEENIGKTVGRKDYEILYHNRYIKKAFN